VKHASQIDGHVHGPVSGCEFEKRRHCPSAGIVHDNVDTAEGVDHIGYKLLASSRICQIRSHRDALRSLLFNRLNRGLGLTLLASVRHRNSRAIPRERQSYGSSQSGRAPGPCHERPFSVERQNPA
jgi:hypothetical protein